MINNNKIKSKTEVLLDNFGIGVASVRDDLNFFFAHNYYVFTEAANSN